jgi:hypothetical protein
MADQDGPNRASNMPERGDRKGGAHEATPPDDLTR